MPIKSNNIDIPIKVLQDKNISYVIVKGQSNRFTIKYDRDGMLVIRKPILMTNDEVITLVNKYLKWIVEHYPENNISKDHFHENDLYLFLGETYPLHIIENKHEGVVITNNVMYVYVPTNRTVKDVLIKWKKEQAETIFSEILYQSFNRMQKDINTYPNLEIKHYVSRWGCCYPKRNKISLNIALIHVPISLIEYVVCHELSHFVHLDHSPAFHNFLRKYIPDENNKRKMLKKYQSDYE